MDGATLFVAGLASINVARSHELHEDTLRKIYVHEVNDLEVYF